MRTFASALTLLAAALFAPAFAHADSFSIVSTLAPTDPNYYTFSFDLPATPTLTAYGGGEFSVAASVTRNGVLDPNDTLNFLLLANGGGMSDHDSSFFPYGPQLFSGTIAAPTFLPGIYDLSNVQGGSTDYILTITAPPAVPEPSSLLLLGTGAIGLATAVRRRKLA